MDSDVLIMALTVVGGLSAMIDLKSLALKLRWGYALLIVGLGAGALILAHMERAAVAANSFNTFTQAEMRLFYDESLIENQNDAEKYQAEANNFVTEAAFLTASQPVRKKALLLAVEILQYAAARRLDRPGSPKGDDTNTMVKYMQDLQNWNELNLVGFTTKFRERILAAENDFRRHGVEVTRQDADTLDPKGMPKSLAYNGFHTDLYIARVGELLGSLAESFR